MDVSYAAVGEALVVAPVGRVDEASWEEFGRHLASGIEQAEQQSLPTLVIDLSSVDYMSSRGLRALTMAKQEGIGHAAIEGRKTMVIDLSGVEYMSSRGLRALTMAKQEGIASGVSIRLAAPNDVMREILAISRYDRLFAVDPVAPSGDS